jgi:hypothetical protein
MPGVLYAAFEPSAITIDNATTGNVPQTVPDTLDAVITPTTSDTTGFTLQEYVYLWNNSSAPLDDIELGTGGNSVPHGDSIVISTDTATQFANSDGLAWYLHVKTVYSSLPAPPGIALSDDTIVGPYTFDNVPPTATISLDTSVAGQTATTASGSPVTLLVSGQLADIFKVYVNSAEQFSTATAYDFSNPVTITLEYAVSGTGSKTLYAWFEDEVGNRTGDAVKLTFSIVAKTMDPAGVLTLEVDATQAFEITGTSDGETFDWTIVDAISGLASTAAAFEGASTGVATVVIKGVTENETVKVKAVSNDDAAVYESGVISVVEKSQAFCLDVDDNGEVDAFTDGFLVVRYLFDFPGDFLIDGVVGPGANRTTAADIIAYLDAAKADLSLDVDDNGEVDAFTDGFLVVRYLFDFPGDFLIDGVVGPGAARSTAADIITYLDAAKCGL